MTKQRNSSIEILRILSMLMVLTLHYLNFGGFLVTVNLGDVNFIPVWGLEALSIVAVNCYVLITGYFLVTAKFKISRILRTWAIVWVYSIGVYLVCVVIGFTEYQKKDLIDSLFPVLTKQFWFVNAFLILSALSPLLNWVIRRLKHWQMAVLCFILFGLFSFWQSIRLVGDISYGPLWFVCLYCFAAYLRLYYKVRCRPWVYLAGYLLGSAAILLLKLRYQQSNPNLTQLFYRYNFVIVLFSSICLFLFFNNLQIKNNFLNRWIPKVSILTFSTYIVHQHLCLYIRLWTDLFKTGDFHTTPLFLLNWVVAVGITLTVCVAVDWVRNWVFESVETGVAKLVKRIKN